MEYEECIDCDNFFFDDDIVCTFEEGGVEDRVDVDDEVIDYDIFVFDENNLRKEIANIFIPDPKEKSHITSRKINNVTDLYLAPTERHEPFMQHFKPVVSLRKYIHVMPKDAKKPVIMYDGENHETETIQQFVTRKIETSPSNAFRPFLETNANKQLLDDVDVVYPWQLGNTVVVEEKRALKGENVKQIGLANFANMTHDSLNSRVSDFALYAVSDYIMALKLLTQGAEVSIVPHDNVAGVEHEKAVVLSNDGATLELQQKNGSTLTLGIENDAQVLSAPFSVRIKDMDLYCKFDFINNAIGGYIALVSDPHTLPLLYPTPSEWLYCKSDAAKSIYSLKDAERAFLGPITAIPQDATDIIAKNIAKAKAKIRARAPVKLVRKIYRQKEWPALLQLPDFRYERSSTDSQYARMLHLTQGTLFQQQVLELIKTEADSIESNKSAHTAKQPASSPPTYDVVVDTLNTHFNNAKKNATEMRKYRVFDHFGLAYASKPHSLDEIAVVYGITMEKPDKANPNKKAKIEKGSYPILAGLSAFEWNGHMVWTVDARVTKQIIEACLS